MNELKQVEIEHLLQMLKTALIQEIDFPQKGNSFEFDATGELKKDLFAIKIYRGKIRRNKYEIGARIKRDGILLLELHVNPGNVHVNPDGQKIIGSHWHIYTEKYGRRQAFPATDVRADDFVESTINFLKKFNIINIPSIQYQMELL